MVFKSIIIFTFLLSTLALGSEIDSFKGRLKKLKDASPAINKFVQNQLVLALDDANSFKGCSKDRLIDAVKGRLADADILGVGMVEKFVAKSNLVERNHIPHDESIYQDISLIDGFALHVYGMGTVVRVKNHYIGSDKLGHFFFDGWKYYSKAFGPRGKGAIKAYHYGKATDCLLYTSPSPRD